MKRPWQKHMQRAVNNGHITPGEFLAAAVIDLAVLCGLGVLLWLCLGFASGAKGAELVPGSVIATRNRVESLNTSPGSLNHLSIYVGNGEVIESQGGVVENQGPGVIKTKLSDFLARGYETPLVLLPRDRAAGERAATKAASLVGTKFRKASSIFNRFGNRRTERGLNCVALVEVCYSDAGKRLRRITKPDDIFKLDKVFEPARRLELKPAESSPEASQGSDYTPHSSLYTQLHVPDRYGWYVHKRGQRGGILRELMSRCPQYGLAQIRSFDQATQTHEACHFVNHELSQHFQQDYGAFYVGDGRYCVVPAPRVTIGQVAQRVPAEHRTPRYRMYLCGDRVSRNCLSILDEQCCYLNDAQCTRELQLPEDGGLKNAKEFCVFANCLVETVKELDANYEGMDLLTSFVSWQNNRAEELSK